MEITFTFQPGTFDLSANEGSMTDMERKRIHRDMLTILIVKSCFFLSLVRPSKHPFQDWIICCTNPEAKDLLSKEPTF